MVHDALQLIDRMMALILHMQLTWIGLSFSTPETLPHGYLFVFVVFEGTHKSEDNPGNSSVGPFLEHTKQLDSHGKLCTDVGKR